MSEHECNCRCHTHGGLHVRACCAGQCPNCEKYIHFGFWEDHKKECAAGNTDEPRAVMRGIDGELVLEGRDAVSVIQAVSKHNCKGTLELNADRVTHFKKRLNERGMAASEAVIVLLNVDDVNGVQLANILMPEYNWQGAIRDQGKVLFVRGLASREGIQEALGIFDEQAAAKLQGIPDVAVVVVDHGVVEVFPT